MRRITLRSLWEHKRRLISTVVAIVLGVAFMSGTFVLSDTIDRVFDDLFAQGFENVDAQVTGELLFSEGFGGDQRALLDPALVQRVAALPEVRTVEPRVASFGFGSTNRVLDADGDAIGAAQGPPTILESWFDGSELTPYVLASGRGPKTDDEMALNVAAVDEGDFALGDRVTVVGQFGPKEYTLVGTVLYGTAESSAGAVSVQLTLAEAQRLAGTDGKVQQVLAGAADGVSQRELADAIQAVVPEGARVLTGVEAGAELSSDVQSGFAFFQTMLTVFGGIALLVGVFVISNTFAILVAQRTRQLALLRAVGASRGQVLGSVLLEALLVGFVAAVLGLVSGIGLAKLVTAALDAAGSDLPTRSLVLRPSTAIAALVIGLVVTVVAAVAPAVRATRVAPLAALRDVAIDRSGASRIRVGLGVGVLALGLLNLSRAWTAGGDTDVVPGVGLGAVLIIVAAIVIGPVLAAPSVRLLGRGLPRLKGVTGRLATENAARSPKRTSASAAALLIGVALVAFITVFADSAKTSIDAEVGRGFAGDFVVQSASGGFGPPSGFPVTVASSVKEVPGVDTVVAMGFGQVQVTFPDGAVTTQFLTSIDPVGLTAVLSPRMTEGDLTALTDDGITVDVALAEDHGLELGDTVTVTAPGGASRELVLESVSDDLTLLGMVTITRGTNASIVPEPTDSQVYGTLAEGADLEETMAKVEAAVDYAPGLEVLDRDGFAGSLADQITSFVTVIYALLVLSIVIAMIGIANTLSLSINERIRELGLLRAVGMDRAQLRSAVRWEAVLISTLGALTGIALGLFLSLAMVRALETFGLTTFSVPIPSLVVIALLAALLGTLASLRPSARAARLPVLDAIATE